MRQKLSRSIWTPFFSDAKKQKWPYVAYLLKTERDYLLYTQISSQKQSSSSLDPDWVPGRSQPLLVNYYTADPMSGYAEHQER